MLREASLKTLLELSANPNQGSEYLSIILCPNIGQLDHNKQRYTQLKEQIAELERKRVDLEIQTNEVFFIMLKIDQNIQNNLSFPEARDRLLAKVKEDNNIIQNTEKRVKEVRKMMENYEKQIKEMSSENEENKNSEQEKQKYEILYQRDKEMTEFIDNFESLRAAVIYFT